MSPSRRYVARNPLRLVELPPTDEKPRLRVAFAAEAEQLLAALQPEDALPYAIAFYAGLRRSEIRRLEWPDVLASGRVASRVLVARAKTEAGTERRPPIAEPLRAKLVLDSVRRRLARASRAWNPWIAPWSARCGLSARSLALLGRAGDSAEAS